jgi:hypothetical protein
VEPGTDLRNMFLCTAILAAAIIVVWPFADIGYADDPAYAHVALTLERIGHLLYNGWESAFLVLHAFWGALFIRVFGFSFVCLRLSTIPFALGSVGLCYGLVRRGGLQAREAVLVTLLFGLSPLFLPLAISFMTDVPAVFFMFASLYAFIRAEETSKGRRGYVWLMLGVVTGFLGGTTRQVVWLVPLIVLPYLAWVRRFHKRLRMGAVIAWFLVLGGVIYTTKWFNHQPYTVFQPSVFSELKLLMKRPLWAINVTARLGLMLMLVALPAAVPLLWRALVDTWRGPRGRQILVAALFLLVLTAVVIHPSLASIPWLASTLNWEGVNGSAPLPGRPIVLVGPIRAVVALAVYAAICLLSGELFRVRRVECREVLRVLGSPCSEFPLVAMSFVSIAYFILLVTRSIDFDIFDRYLLPILPWVATVLLLWFKKDNPGAERMFRRAMPVAWALLAVLAFYAIASTQDLWALAAARVAATRKLESAGVPRTAIDAGFEYNAWTELQIKGRLNSRWVLNPPGAYRPGLSQTPSVVPAYRLEYAPTAETEPSELSSVSYFSLLPPFRKHVSIDRIVVQRSVN